MPWRGGFDGVGRLVEAANVRVGNEFRSALVRYNESMQLVDTIVVPHFDESAFEVTNADRSIVASVPYAPSMVWSFSLDGTVWSGAGRYLGEVHSPTTLRGLRFHDGRVFALATDSFGVTYVVRLRIEPSAAG